MGRKAHESRLAFLSSEHRFVPADSASRLRVPGEKNRSQTGNARSGNPKWISKSKPPIRHARGRLKRGLVQQISDRAKCSKKYMYEPNPRDDEQKFQQCVDFSILMILHPHSKYKRHAILQKLKRSKL